MLQKQATITTFELHSLNIICHKVNRIEIKQTTAPRVCNNSLFAKKESRKPEAIQFLCNNFVLDASCVSIYKHTRMYLTTAAVTGYATKDIL